MSKGRAALLVVASIVFLTVGFVIGQMVQAAGSVPGSVGDPLVAQSYVEKVVGETVAGLQTKLDEMQAQVESLEAQIESLSSGKAASISSNQTTNSQTDASKETESTSSEPASQTKGKIVTVSGESANIRSGPGTTYDKITTLLKGDTAQYVSEENGWIKLILKDGKEGWVANWLVTVK